MIHSPSPLGLRPPPPMPGEGERRSRRERGLPSGFTLLEVAMAILLFSLLVAVVVPGFGALTGAEMRKTMSQLQGLTRDTYARTALTGNSHRIVFDLEGNAFWVEATEGGAVMKRELQVSEKEGVGVLQVLDERLEGLEDSEDPEDMEKKRLFAGPTWQPVDDDTGKPLQLPSDLRILRVWADHLEEPVERGQAAVHFFPGGYVQEAHITVTDDEEGENTLTLITEPLTGETLIVDEIPRLP